MCVLVKKVFCGVIFNNWVFTLKIQDHSPCPSLLEKRLGDNIKRGLQVSLGPHLSDLRDLNLIFPLNLEPHFPLSVKWD